LRRGEQPGTIAETLAQNTGLTLVQAQNVFTEANFWTFMPSLQANWGVTDQATFEAHWRQVGGTLRGTWPHEFGRHRGI
jgi:hypothetical protein